MFKNVASQKLTVLAFADAGHATLDPGEPVTGDAANISCKVEQDDDGTQSATNDVAPTEVEDGQYRFDLTQAETNGDKLTFYPQSSTAGVQVVSMPSNVIYTRPPNFSALGIESDGDVTQVNTLNGHTAQTADHTAGIAAIPTTAMRGTDSAALASVCTEGRLAELDAANLPASVDAIPTTAMRGTDSAALASVCTEARLAELDAANIPADIDAIPTTAMRGTDSAALASVCTEGRLAELDAANLPTDIAAIPTTAMRGTDSAALASVATEARLAELDAANIPADIDAIPTTAMRGTDSAATEAKQDIIDANVDANKVILDALTAAAAAKLAASAGTIIIGTVDTVTNTHTPTTTEFQADDVTEATADHYNGRIVIWTTGALAGQATDITDYVAVGGIGQFTVTAMTEAPANNDTFVIV